MKIPLAYDTEGQKADRYELLAPLELEAGGQRFTIPAGFWSDGASVPGLLQGIIHPVYRDFPADVFHDFFYTYCHFYGYTRKEIDRLWLDLMRQFNRRNYFRTYVKYGYVRALGWYNWNYYKRQAKAGKLKPFEHRGLFSCPMLSPAGRVMLCLILSRRNIPYHDRNVFVGQMGTKCRLP